MPDGSNLVIVLNPFAIEPHVRKVNYDPITSFEPVCYLAKTPSVLVVNAASPYKTLGDLLNAARAKPGELTLASSGPATASFIAFERLKSAAKVDMVFVPYTGIPPAINALLGEHVTSVFGVYTPAVGLINTGKLRPLAAGSPKRIDALPDVPTIAEAGYPGIEADLWTWLMVPAKTPKDVIAQLSGWFREALEVPDIRSRLVAQGIYPVAICGAEFAAMVRRQYEEYGQFIREHKIKVE